MQEFFFQYIEQWSYFGLFFVLFAAGLGLPLPEDIPLLAAGWLASEHHANLYGMMATGLIGVMVGDTIMFMLGRRYGSRIIEHRFFSRIMKPWLVAKAREKFDHHGAKIIFVARFMPGLRAVMFVTAGIFRIPYWKFITFDGSAAMISVPLWVWCGFYFPQQIQHILGGTKLAGYLIVGAFVALFIAVIAWEYVHNYRKQQAEATAARSGLSTPPIGRDAPESPSRDTPPHPAPLPSRTKPLPAGVGDKLHG